MNQCNYYSNVYSNVSTDHNHGPIFLCMYAFWPLSELGLHVRVKLNESSVNIGFEVLTVIKRAIIWEINPRNSLKVNQHFRETCYFHLQDGSMC
jgi:hypothetical protein